MTAAGDQLAEAVAALGGVAVAPPVLQPAELYVQLGGEAVRGRAFTVMDARGGEHALRPDMTAPAVRVALGLPHWQGPGFWVTYDGPVFRREDGRSAAEFRQIGAERFSPRGGGPKGVGPKGVGPKGVGPEGGGPEDDAEVLAAAIGAVRACGAEPSLKLGDVAMFAAAAASLDLPQGWAERLVRAFAAPGGPAAALAEAERREAPPAGPLEEAIALLPADEAAPAVARLWAAQGLSAVGGRSAEDVAARLRERAARRTAPRPTPAQIAALREALALCGPPQAVFDQLRARIGGAPLEAAIASASRRIDVLAGRLSMPGDVQFCVGFGRGLAYYDGMVFELEAGGTRLGGGGRYDGLLQETARRERESRPGLEAWGAAGFGLRPDRIDHALATLS